MLESQLNVTRIGEYLYSRFHGEEFAMDIGQARAGGVSNLNVLAVGDRGTKLIIRMPPDDGVLNPYDLAHESACVKCAELCNVAVPHILDVGTSDAFGGRQYMVMAFVDGEVVVPKKNWSQQHSRNIAKELVDVLAQIHRVRIDEAIFKSYGTAVRDVSANAVIARWSPVLEGSGEVGTPVTPTYVRSWLLDRIPSTSRSMVLIHGDYRLGNMIWIDDEIKAVLDWEEAGLGDAYYDLAWILMGTFQDDDLVMGLTRRSQFLQWYGRASGRMVDETELRWWEVLTAWVRVCMEVKSIELSQRAKPSDLRSLIWEFGHGSTYRQMLRQIEYIDHGGAE